MDCAHFPRLGYGEFSERLHEKTARLHIPISGSLEVTHRCNLRCVHCYIPMKARRGPPEADLTLAEIKGILAEIKEAGCLWLLLTGGEPLLRPDFLEIYTYARQKGFLLTLFTNGTLLTPTIADVLKDWRPFNIEITLYGYSQATYERITGVPGSYTRCIRGIELLVERRLPFKLKTMVMSLNRHELGDMHSFARSLGMSFRIDPILNAGLDGSTGPSAFRLTPEEVVDVDRAEPGRPQLWAELFKQAADFRPDPGRLYTCGAGLNTFHIDSHGRLCLCLTERLPGYDLRAGSFREGWESLIPRLRAQEHSPAYACAACDMRTACAQCPALARHEHGDPEQRVAYFCQVTNKRREVFADSH